jgi:molecular chaperone DnaK (HSP70)
MNVFRIINDPTASAIAYGLDKKVNGEHNILIFDLGGGTCDVPVSTTGEGIFEVKATTSAVAWAARTSATVSLATLVQEFKRKNKVNIICFIHKYSCAYDGLAIPPQQTRTRTRHPSSSSNRNSNHEYHICSPQQ